MATSTMIMSAFSSSARCDKCCGDTVSLTTVGQALLEEVQCNLQSETTANRSINFLSVHSYTGPPQTILLSLGSSFC